MLIVGVLLFVVGLYLLLWSHGRPFKYRVAGFALCIVTVTHAALWIGFFFLWILCCFGIGKKKGGGQYWNRGSAEIYRNVLTVQVHDHKVYNADGKSPVLFLLPHQKREGHYDSVGLGLLEQPNVRVVASFPPSSPFGKILSLNDYVYVNTKPGGAFDAFMTETKKAIKKGKSLIIFPEGRNSAHQKSWRHLTPFKSGAFILSREFNLPIVPVIFEGKRGFRGFLTPGQFNVHFLPPIYPEPFPTTDELKFHVQNVLQTKLDSL